MALASLPVRRDGINDDLFKDAKIGLANKGDGGSLVVLEEVKEVRSRLIVGRGADGFMKEIDKKHTRDGGPSSFVRMEPVIF